jgi:hypothetical protein
MTSIAQERQRYADVGLTMRIRPQWGARFDYTTAREVIEPATILVAHVAVVNDPGDLVGTEDQVMRNIENIGIARFPNTGISYNAAAFNTGRLYEGQPIGRRGAHTVNTRQRSTCIQSGCPSLGDSITAPSWNNNVNARACVAPQMPDDPCTDAQVDAFARWGAGNKLAGFVTRDARWHGHRCFAAKDCPGGRVWARLDDIQDLTADYVRDGLPGTGDDMPLTPGEIQQVAEAAARAVWEYRLGNLNAGTEVESGKLVSDIHRNTEDLQTEPPEPVA